MSEQKKRKRIYRDYLDDIRIAIDEIEEFTREMDYDAFSHDRKTSHAVIRCFEIIGEAVKKLPDALKAKYPAVPWREIAAMRDKMIHEYFGVNLLIVWQTIADDLPFFKGVINGITHDTGEVAQPE